MVARLEMKATTDGTVAYQLSADSIQPHTIYLVAADGVVRAAGAARCAHRARTARWR